MPRCLKIPVIAPAVLLCLLVFFLSFLPARSSGAAAVRRPVSGAATGAATSAPRISVLVDFAPGQVHLERAPSAPGEAAAAGHLDVRLDGATQVDLPAGSWPERQVLVAVPDGMEPADVTIRGIDPVVVAGLGPADVPFDTSKLPQIGSAPGQWTGTEWMRGTRILTLRLDPLAWDAAGARLWSRIRIDVTLRAGVAPADVWRPERPGTQAALDFRRLLRSIVINPDDVSDVEPGASVGGGTEAGDPAASSGGGTRDAGPTPISGAAGQAPGSSAPDRGGVSTKTWSGGSFSPLFRPSVTGSPVDYVIITGAALAAEYQRLADWRTRTGTLTVVRTVEWIDSQYPEGFDQPDRIRRFIKDAASRWGTQWVLLGGDVDVVPIRLGRSTYYFGENIATDLYYQCLDGNWNADGDELFGEAGQDNADLVPEVWVSRIPLSTVDGVRTVIDKTFQYEKTPPGGGYIPSFLVMAEVLEPSEWEPGMTINADGGVMGQNAIAQFPPSFRVTRMYENYTAPTWAGLAVPELKSAVIDSINAGYEIVHHIGHGYRNNLSVGVGGQQIFREDADQFMNATKPFLFYGINCNSAAVDYDCIAEHLLANTHGGCFAYIGSTRFDFPEDSETYQREFYRSLFRDQSPIGKAHAISKLANVANAGGEGPVRWHQMSLICLGDPLVRMRSAAPKPLEVTYLPVANAGTPLLVTVKLDGVPLSGARVTLFRQSDLFVTDTTGADGTVSLPVAVETAGTISLTATWLNALPFETTLPVGLPAAAPYLSISGLGIDDSVVGNSDGRLDPGETARLNFRITNIGGASAQNVTLGFWSPGDSIVVANATTDLANLAPGESDSTFETQVIQVSVPASITRPTDVTGRLTLTWSGGSRTDPVVLHIGGVQLWVAKQVVIDDPGGPGQNGVVAPGELVELRPEIMNRGLSVARNVRLRLETLDHRATLGRTLVEVGTIGAGVTTPLPLPLTFTVTDLAAIPGITLIFEADGVEQFRRPVDVSPPPAPGIVSAVSHPTTILLKWDQVADAALRGYAIFRATAEAGPFTQLNPVVDNPMGFYEDGPLARFVRYYYRIAAQDSSGNLSAFSAVFSFVTSFPSLPNWPHQRNAATPSSPVVHDLDGDGKLEIIVGGEEIYAMHADGSEYLDGDKTPLTLGVLTRTAAANFWGTPAVADVDGDGILEIVAAGWLNGKLYVFGADGSVKPGWPRSIGGVHLEADAADPWGSPLVEDVDGDGKKEIFICSSHYLYGFHFDGTEIRDGDSDPATIGPLVNLGQYFNYGTPAGADFDHDGHIDIVVGTRNGNIHLLKGDGTEFPGFPKAQGGAITSSPAIADLDKDGELEMIFAVNSLAEVRAINRFGVSPPGWPGRVNVNQDLDSSPTVADIDNDGNLDVVIAGGNGSVRAWRGSDGQMLPGFPADLQSLEPNTQAFIVRGTPCLGDVTGDGVPDILVGTQAGTLYGLSATGQLLPGFPLYAFDSIEGGPLLWDIDGDGHTNIIFASMDRYIYAFDTPGIFVAGPDGTCPWPMFRHDQSNSGYVGHLVTTPVEPQLAQFEIAATDEGVVLSWRADAFSGWQVWRSDPAAGTDERLNGVPLAGGAGVHRFLDVAAVPGTRYEYRLAAIDRDGRVISFAPVSFLVPQAVPPAFRLSQNAPNPVREGTVIPFTLAADASGGTGGTSSGGSAAGGAGGIPGGDGSGSPVRLEIFDANGRAVRTLVNGIMSAGAHVVAWNGADEGGRRVAAGVYFYRLEAGGKTSTRKMVVAR